MSPGLEFVGSNVENAVDNACNELNIPREKLKYDVISYGSSGIFGLVGAKKARIRVITSDLPSEPKTEKAEGKKPEDLKEETFQKSGEKIPAEFPKEETIAPQTIPDIPENPAELGKQLLQRIVDVITTDASIVVEENPEQIYYRVNGGNAAILIGKRGQTLEAIQYIVEKVLNKHNGQRVRVQVDIEGYLEMRRDNLRQLALRLAEKAKRTGKPVTIGQMNAHDRRIVHLCLKDDHTIRTKSVGDGFLRKLVIFPKKTAHQKENAKQEN